MLRRQKSLGPHQTRNQFLATIPVTSLPPFQEQEGSAQDQEYFFFVLYFCLTTQPQRDPSSKVRASPKWRAGGGKCTNSSPAQILALAVPQQAPAAQLIKSVTNAILNSFIKGRFYFIEKKEKPKKTVVSGVDKIISTGSNVLKCWLWVFHLLLYLSLLSSAGKHSHPLPFVSFLGQIPSPDTGKVFNLPLKPPGVLSEQDAAFCSQFSN